MSDSEMNRDKSISRRDFIKTSATSATALTTLAALNPSVFAAGSDTVKVALVGCGGRGRGALANFLEACEILKRPVEIVALADPMPDRVDKAVKDFKTSADIGHVGFDSYRKAVATDAHVIVMAPPPLFRPLHLDAAIEAGKHVFMEKPVAVDPPGCRKIIAIGEKADQKGLSIVAGTQRRYDAKYRRAKHAIDQGAIGQILGGCVWWCSGELWFRRRQPGMSAAEYLVRNWVSFTELSGDHIVEQHIHNIDIANWYLGRTPRTAVGFGGRARRKTGNQFDFFSIDFDYGEGVHIHSMCRQVHGTWSRVREFFRGTEGQTYGDGSGMKGNKDVTPLDYPERNPYVQEHVALLESIFHGKPINEARQVAEANASAIMGRISAYTGQVVRYADLMKEGYTEEYYNLTCTPTAEAFETGNVVIPAEDGPPIPGREKT